MEEGKVQMRSSKQDQTENRQDSTRCQNRTGSDFYTSTQCWNRQKGSFNFTRGRSTGSYGGVGESFRMGFEMGDTTRTCRRCGRQMEREGYGEFQQEKQ